jgi:hypothetical protein
MCFLLCLLLLAQQGSREVSICCFNLLLQSATAACPAAPQGGFNACAELDAIGISFMHQSAGS